MSKKLQLLNLLESCTNEDLNEISILIKEMIDRRAEPKINKKKGMEKLITGEGTGFSDDTIKLLKRLSQINKSK